MNSPRIGVCSWSLEPGSERDLVARVAATGLDAVQIALDPIRLGEMSAGTLEQALREAGITILSGMMAMAGEDYTSLDSIRRTGGLVPDATWSANLAAAHENARIASALGIRLVTFHAGFIPEDTAGRHGGIVERIRAVAHAFEDHGVQVALETGQETAPTLLALLAGLGTVGVNFDPANMILYGKGDPVAGLERLLPRVVQVHVKDAIATTEPGTWGTEVPVGEGDVDWAAFFATLRRSRRSIGLVVEREAGANRIADVECAARLVRTHLTGVE